jgi:hypothetical protein
VSARGGPGGCAPSAGSVLASGEVIAVRSGSLVPAGRL